MTAIIAVIAGFFPKDALKNLLTNKLVWAAGAVILAYFAGYNGAKTKFTNYAVVAALEAENGRLALEYNVLLDASKATAAQLAARTSLQIQQDKVIEDYKASLQSDVCTPSQEFLDTLESLTGTTK